MKHLISLFFAFLLCLVLISCGGGTGSETEGEPGGDGSGAGIGPLVDSGGIDENLDFPFKREICDPSEDERLNLEITQVTNAHNSVFLADQFRHFFPMEIYTGDEHRYFVDPPEEPQTRIQFELSSDQLGVNFPLGVFIEFVFLDDILDNDEHLTHVTSFSNENGINIIDPVCSPGVGSCLGVYDDTLYPGVFDMVREERGGVPGIPPEWPDWNDQILVAQVCEATIDDPDEGPVFPVSSNPIYFKVIPGMPWWLWP